MKNASRPAAMRPRLSSEPNTAKPARPVTRMISRRVGGPAPKSSKEWLPHAALTPYCDFSFAAIADKFRSCAVCWEFPDSTFGQHVGKDAFHFVFVASGVIP